VIALTRARGGVLKQCLAQYRGGKSTAASSCHVLNCCVFIPADLEEAGKSLGTLIYSPTPDGGAGQLRSESTGSAQSRQYIRLGFCQPALLFEEAQKRLGVAEQLGCNCLTTSSLPSFWLLFTKILSF